MQRSKVCSQASRNRPFRTDAEVDVLPGQGNEERNKPERFEKAFKDVPRDAWFVFKEPEELYEKIDALAKL